MFDVTLTYLFICNIMTCLTSHWHMFISVTSWHVWRRTDRYLFICNIMTCLTSHWQINFISNIMTCLTSHWHIFLSVTSWHVWRHTDRYLFICSIMTCLTSHWQIIFSVRFRLLIVTISLIIYQSENVLITDKYNYGEF